MIESHVTSLQLSKRLKELGVPQRSEFYWHKVQRPDWVVASREQLMEPVSSGPEPEDCWPILDQALSQSDACSAFLASELGEMLPVEYTTQEGGIIWRHNLQSARIRITGTLVWDSYYADFDDKENDVPSFHAPTEADARAKLLIHLIEQGIVIYPPL